MTFVEEVPEDAEQLEAVLRAIPDDSGLEGDEQEQFRRLRRRIGQRQADWRRSMGSLGPLFDDEAHRAKALAGNLATELSQVLEVWARLQSEHRRPTARDLPPLLAWVAEVSARWQLEATRYIALEGWDHEAAEVFNGFLGEICERSVDRASQRLRDADPVRVRGRGSWGMPGRWVKALGAALGRLFHPRPSSR